MTHFIAGYSVLEFASGTVVDALYNVDFNLVFRSSISEYLPLSWKISVLLDTVKALRYLHTHNIIHRELCPSTLYISTQANKYGYGIVKLGGFGTAKSQDSDTMQTFSTDDSYHYSYSAPEILACKDFNTSYTTAGEMYAFGVLILEVIFCLLYLKIFYATNDLKHVTAPI